MRQGTSSRTGKDSSKASKDSKPPESGGDLVTTFSVTARALSIPELLSLVFSFSGKPELASSARVCKSWKDTALDELWRDLDSIFPLLELVLDVDLLDSVSRNQNPSAHEAVSSALVNADWSRFHSHAKRVQSLAFDDSADYRGTEEMPGLESSVIGIICLHYTYGPILLPHLRKAKWSIERYALPILPFLSKDLAHLDLELYESSDTLLKEAFDAFRNRTLNLKTFRFYTYEGGPTSEAALGPWLETMKTLEKVMLPDYYLTAQVLTRIAALPELRVIDRVHVEYKLPLRYNDARMAGSLPSGSFPRLAEITLPETPAAAKRLLFDSHTYFSGLTRLDLNADKDIKADHVIAFTQDLAAHCPNITTIGLALSLRSAFRDQGVSVLPVEILESLYPCKHLTSLRIGYPLPLKFGPTDVENMGCAWSKMTQLSLCAEPDFSFSVSEDMGVTVDILPSFALHMPNLRTLGLYFNSQDQITFEGHLYYTCQFNQLDELHVGYSSIPKSQVRELGFYLASLCSRDVNVRYGNKVLLRNSPPPDEERHEAAWQAVKEMMSFAMQIKLAGEFGGCCRRDCAFHSQSIDA
ncbi:hypothetical protein FRC00_010818 [Tulasnella sp. 408]|nr:hypothetical protein FRC00_010818 [Tulasnella sp. 408]